MVPLTQVCDEEDEDMNSMVRRLLPVRPTQFRVLWWPLHILLVAVATIAMIMGNTTLTGVAATLWLGLYVLQFVIDVYFGSDRFQLVISGQTVVYDPGIREIKAVFNDYYSTYLWAWDIIVHNTIFLKVGKHVLEQTAKAQFIDNIAGRYPRYRQLTVTIKVGTNLSPDDAVAFYEATQFADWEEPARIWLMSQFQLFLDRCDALAEIRDPINDQARLEQIIREEFGPVLAERWGPYLRIYSASFSR